MLALEDPLDKKKTRQMMTKHTLRLVYRLLKGLICHAGVVETARRVGSTPVH